MRYNKMELLSALSAYQFACIELNLYLDNNPNDENALRSYNTYYYNYMQAKLAYENEYGPLTNFGYVPEDSSTWQWASNPWPWDNEFYE